MRYCLLLIAALLLTASLGLAPASMVAVLPISAVTSTGPTTEPDEETPTTEPASQPSSQPASQPASGPSTRPTTSAASKPTSEPTTQPAEQKERYLAIVGGIVHPVTGATMHGATILCKDGVIQAIGRMIELPEITETIDVTGFHVYPGLIACSSRGIVGTEPPQDNTNVFATNMRLANAGGLTTVVTGNTAAKVTFGSLEGLELRKNLFTSLRYRTTSQRRALRGSLDNVRKYLRDKEAYDRKKAEGDEEAKPPEEGPIKGGNEKFYKLIKKETVGLITADRKNELIEVCNLARDYGIRIVVSGAMEGWTIPGRMGRAGIKAILTPRRQAGRDDRKMEPDGGNIENASILYQHGVDVAIMAPSGFIGTGGLAGRDLQHLPMAAAYAVRGGLTEQAAIESITIAAARILGIDDRAGSIEEGKDADFTVTDGHLLDFYTTVQWTIVNGRVVYDKQEETLFADIRPRTPTTRPAAYKFWPRPFKPRPAPKRDED